MKKSYSILALVMALGLITIPVFSQEDKKPQSETITAPAAIVAVPQGQATPEQIVQTPILPGTEPENTLQVTQPEEMSIYGEVKSLDEATSSIKLQYYDYDNDEEKTADVVLEKDTKLENAQGLHDIRVGDWVDAVYVTKDGKNIARSVIVEKEEEDIPVKADTKTDEKPQEAAPEE